MKVTRREDDYGNEFHAAYCRCEAIFVGQDDEEAVARWRVHVKQVEGLAAIAEARKALEGGTDGS